MDKYRGSLSDNLGQTTIGHQGESEFSANHRGGTKSNNRYACCERGVVSGIQGIRGSSELEVDSEADSEVQFKTIC